MGRVVVFVHSWTAHLAAAEAYRRLAPLRPTRSLPLLEEALAALLRAAD